MCSISTGAGGELTADCSISWAARRWNSEVELVDGKGSSGTGLPRNSHSGSQPSATSNCSRRCAGIVLFTSASWRHSPQPAGSGRGYRSAKVTICNSPATIFANRALLFEEIVDTAETGVWRILENHSSALRTEKITFASGYQSVSSAVIVNSLANPPPSPHWEKILSQSTVPLFRGA